MSDRWRRRLAAAVVRGFAVLVPHDERDRWKREWLAEIECSKADGVVGHSLGAAPHAVFLFKDAWRWDVMHRDVHYALRSLLHRPGFLIAAAVTLAVGIGANAALFSVIDAVLLRPQSYGEPERILSVFETQDGGITRDGPGPANLLDWRRQSETLDGIAAWWVESTTLLGDRNGETEEVPSARVTADFFRVLAVEPILGRTFTDAEVADGEPVAVLSYELWQTRYASDDGVLEMDVRFKNEAWRVIGVMPPRFRPPGTLAGDVLLYKPWDFERDYAHLPEVPRDHRFLRAAARLAPGTTLSQAQAEMDSIAASLSAAYPPTNRGWSVVLVPVHEAIVGDVKPALIILLGASGFLLLLACSNVTSLLLMRASGRSREMAVRTALGASRLRLVRQLVVESILLAGLGAVLGTLFARAGIELVLRFAPAGIPRVEEISIDGRVLMFALAVAALTGLAAGLAPAIHSSSAPPSRGLKDASGIVSSEGTRQRLRSAIVAVEVAAAVLLLTGSGLFLQSFARVLAVEPGFDPERLLVVRMRLDPETYGGGGAHLYYVELLQRLRALPDVISAAGTTALEMDEMDVDFDRPFWRDGEPRPLGGGPGVQIRMATVGYFETMRIPLLAGRTFQELDDRTKPRVLMVNESMARRTWPGASPLGKRIFIDYQNYRVAYEIVGVVGDTRFYGHRSATKPAVYIPHAQNPYLPLNLVIRTASDPAAIAPAARRAVLEQDPNQPVHSMHTMDALVSGHLGKDRFAAFLMTLLAAIALLLATVGLYGAVAYGVSLRRRELGLRLALGADRRDIVKLVLAGGVPIGLVGTAIGLAAAVLWGRFLRAVLFEISPTDATTLGVAAILAIVTVVSACYLPALRASRIDPTTSLRAD
ncbi:MAG TPA: ABC transporter permease [Vicinamibacteria bacterium]|nr:ABC transporter permease [Vicinamibacteria bacterium]